MKKYLKLLRVEHYIKNALIFFPLVFSGELFAGRHFFDTLLGFVSFSLAASVIYIVNDLNDVEADRNNPVKCHRPIASGAITVKTAKIMVVCLIAAVAVTNYLAAGWNVLVWMTLVAYVLLNFGYSFGAKNLALVDVFILVSGYVLRVYYGAAINGLYVSSRLYLTVLFMALFLVLGKRRNEMQNHGNSGRQVLKRYPISFLDKAMYLSLCLTIVFYSLWCESLSHSMGMSAPLLSIVCVLLICFRYCIDIEGNSDGDPVDVVLSDKSLLVLIAIYGVFMFLLLYGKIFRGALSNL